MREFQSFYLHAPVQATLDFRFVSFLQEQLDCFLNHCLGLFEGSSLTGDAKLRARGHVPLSFFLDYCCQLR